MAGPQPLSLCMHSQSKLTQPPCPNLTTGTFTPNPQCPYLVGLLPPLVVTGSYHSVVVQQSLAQQRIRVVCYRVVKWGQATRVTVIGRCTQVCNKGQRKRLRGGCIIASSAPFIYTPKIHTSSSPIHAITFIYLTRQAALEPSQNTLPEDLPRSVLTASKLLAWTALCIAVTPSLVR